MKTVSVEEAQESLGCPSGDDRASLFSRETGDLLAVHFEVGSSDSLGAEFNSFRLDFLLFEKM